MSLTCACTTAAPVMSAALANEAIRRYAAGRQRWTRAELDELARLRTEWQRAVRESTAIAA